LRIGALEDNPISRGSRKASGSNNNVLSSAAAKIIRTRPSRETAAGLKTQPAITAVAKPPNSAAPQFWSMSPDE